MFRNNYRNLNHYLNLFRVFSTAVLGAGLLSSCHQKPDESSSVLRVGTPGYIQHRDKNVYLSGANIAWFDFAKDFGYGLDEKKVRASFQDLSGAGANSVRWWLHTDGAYTPEWGGAGQRLVAGPGQRTIEDMQRALDLAAESGIYIVFSLWSFDMLKDNAHRKPPTHDNYRLLAEDAVLQSYIDNALIPMVLALNGHPRLLAWELFNEPENMTEEWFPQQEGFYGGPVPSLERLQRVQALMAAAIHKTARAQKQRALVTTGSKSLGKYNSDVAGGVNLYRDDRLIAAADGDPDAAFDFYAPHYYNNENRNGAWSPFHHPISYWQLDKAIVIGEFHIKQLVNAEGQRVKAKDLCRTLKEKGYAGGWAWQWIENQESIESCLKTFNSSISPEQKM